MRRESILKLTLCLVVAVGSLQTSFAKDLDEGVPLSCDKKADRKMAKFPGHSRLPVCRDRKNPSNEYYTYCDGSGCTGFTAISTGDNNCMFKDEWTGQDDQDPIDPVQWQKDCLVAADFAKWVTPPKTDMTTRLVIGGTQIRGGSTYSFVTRLASKRPVIERAEAIGKQLRQNYYKKSATVESYSYREITAQDAKELLSQSEGEFKRFSRQELNSIDQWNSDHQVAHVVHMKMVTDHRGGTGKEDNFIFLSEEDSEPALVINRMYFVE